MRGRSTWELSIRHHITHHHDCPMGVVCCPAQVTLAVQAVCLWAFVILARTIATDPVNTPLHMGKGGVLGMIAVNIMTEKATQHDAMMPGNVCLLYATAMLTGRLSVDIMVVVLGVLAVSLTAAQIFGAMQQCRRCQRV